MDGAPVTGDATSTTSPPATTVVTSAASVGTGACKYVTTEQAATLATSAVKPGVNRSLTTGPVTFNYCDYTFDPGNAPGVSVAVADLAGDGPALFSQFRQSKTGEGDYQLVPGVGDEAFFSGQNLNVRKGDTGLILFVGRTNSYPRGAGGLADEKQLATIVLGGL